MGFLGVGVFLRSNIGSGNDGSLSIQNEDYDQVYVKDSNSDLVMPLMPQVAIQGRHRLSSEITSYADYEFPLDEEWEIQPRNRYS